MSELKQKGNSDTGHLPDTPRPSDPYLSYEAFLEWADEDTHAEWVDGKIEMPSPAGLQHQRIALFLGQIIGILVQFKALGEVFPAGLQMKLPGQPGSGREPDLLFVKAANLARLEPGLLRGPADLVIEIVSPNKRDQERDRETKFKEYAAGGVPEYWLLDPGVSQALFYRLDPQGYYQTSAPDSAGKYYSAELSGFWLKAEWLWRDPLPAVQPILKLIGGPDYAAYLNQPLDEKLQAD